MYNFRPSESFYARPFGLVLEVYYKGDSVSRISSFSRCSASAPGYDQITHPPLPPPLQEEETVYCSTVFNGTVNIVEVEEGFDVET